MRNFAIVALFTACASAFTVLSPASADTWSITGSHTVSWSSVSTDRANFTIVLSNQESQPSYTQVLKALVVSADGTTSVDPPAGGWPMGKGFQINLVQDSSNINAILAQSQKFAIEPSSSTQSSSSTTSGSSTYVAYNPATTTGANPSGVSDTSTSPNSEPNGAVGFFNAQTGLIAAVALLGAVAGA